MHKLFLLSLFSSLLLQSCNSNHCSDLGNRYSDIKTEFEKIKTQTSEQKAGSHERLLKKLLKQAQKLESDFEGCGIGNDDNILGEIIDSYKVSQLKSEIEQFLPPHQNNINQGIPSEWEIRSAIRKIEKSLRELHSSIRIDEAGNVEMQGHRFYIESVKIEVVDSGISIACSRNEQCISDNLNATVVPIDHMKAQRILEYLADYKAVVVCKHSKGNCSEIMAKYKN